MSVFNYTIIQYLQLIKVHIRNNSTHHSSQRGGGRGGRGGGREEGERGRGGVGGGGRSPHNSSSIACQYIQFDVFYAGDG